MTRRRSLNWGSGDFDKYITGGWAVQTSAAAASALEWQGARDARLGIGDWESSIKQHVSRIKHHSSTGQAHFDPADAHDIAFFKAGRVAHLDLVYKCAIGAVQVFQHPHIALDLQARVLR